ncbi:autotransporter [Bordetella pertussis]|nr:autotransporter [Bordetella pertussis]
MLLHGAHGSPLRSLVPAGKVGADLCHARTVVEPGRHAAVADRQRAVCGR